MPTDLLLTFLTPERIGVTPFSVVWALPLIASITIVYKATKVYAIRPLAFAKETASLFGAIVGFLLVAAMVLCGIAWLFNEKMALLAG
ncbi:MAG: hypothetical protein HQ515_05340 [Phycisphaeraceae bacterium]|nr:hypothetical protein [Phycisphaeraceae bacterium]